MQRGYAAQEPDCISPNIPPEEYRPLCDTNLRNDFSLSVCRKLLLGGVGVPLGAGVLLLAQIT
jgi:hypothetical protein